MGKKENLFDKCVEMFKEDGADTIILSHYQDGMVSGTPYNSKTGRHWIGMAVVSSLTEALKCKYKKACDENDKELCDILDKKLKEIKL